MHDAIDGLYDLAPSEFTAARDALVKQLRTQKRRDEANAIKSLRRPTVPAWAANQVARRHPDLVEALIAAGNALASAQRRALSGVKDAGMRDAAAQRRSAVDQAWSAAAGILRDADIDPAAHRQAVSDTFEAATAHAQAAEEVRAGRLSSQLPPPSGFGGVTGFSVVADEKAPDQPPDAPPAAAPQNGADPDDAVVAPRRAEQEQADRAARRAREQAQEAAHRADVLGRRSGDARQAAVLAVAQAERLEQRARQARDRADDLLAKAEQAQRDAAAAAHEAERLAAAAAAAAADQAAG